MTELMVREYSYSEQSIFAHCLFRVEEGEINYLIGQNGSGKSTLLDVFVGLIASEQCQKSYQLGQDYVYVNQLLPVHGVIHCRELVKMIWGGAFHQVIDLKFVRKRVNQSIYPFFEVNWDKKLRELSIGEQKILQLYSLLYTDKSVVVMDEPTAFLDRHHAKQLFDTLSRL